MFKRLLALLLLATSQAQASPLTASDLQEVAQTLLTLPPTTQAVRESRTFALTALGQREELKRALRDAPQNRLQLVSVALRYGHPGLLEVLLPPSQEGADREVWGRALGELAWRGQLEEAEHWLSQVPPGPARTRLLAQVAIIALGRDTPPSPQQRQWVQRIAAEARQGLGDLSHAEAALVRLQLATTSFRLGELEQAASLLAAFPLQERNQRWSEFAYEALIRKDTAMLHQVVARIDPRSADEQVGLLRLWGEIGDVPRIVALAARVPRGEARDAVLSEAALRQIERGQPGAAARLLALIEVPEIRLTAWAESAILLARQGNAALAGRWAAEALRLLEPGSTLHASSTVVQALGAAGLTREGQVLVGRGSEAGPMRGAFVQGLIEGGLLPQAREQAALVRGPEGLARVFAGLRVLEQRQRPADIAALLAVLRPEVERLPSPDPSALRHQYLGLLGTTAGKAQVLTELRPGDEPPLYAAATAGQLALTEALLARIPSREPAGVTEGTAALALLQRCHSEQALELFRKTTAAPARALIGVALLTDAGPSSACSSR